MRKFITILFALFCLCGCTKADRVNYNIRQNADNFNVRRKVIALNTRTDKALFAVEGLLSVDTDADGDLNVTIRTGKDEYKLFYAHLSNDVTYTCIQIEADYVTPYAYNISFFPAKEVLEHGLFDIVSSEGHD